MKVVLADPAWEPWADEFRRRLDPVWTLAPGWDELPGAAALIATALPPALLPQARELRMFAYPGAGASHFRPEDLPAKCLLTNVYEHEGPVAEYVLTAMLVHTTGFLQRSESFRRGSWAGSGRVGGEPHRELAGRTAGLFGYGHIGRSVEARAVAFGMRVLPVSRSQGDLDGMLREADFLVVAAPLTPETRSRIGERELGLLPDLAFLINVARAEIVDECALYQALTSGRLAGAALDVWYQYPEPGEDGHGSRLPFHELPNVFGTPHYSAWTRPMILRRIERMTENLNRLASGSELERVVLEGVWNG